MTPPVVVGVDIGGTFTDFVVAGSGGLRIHKVPSTPSDPSEGFLRGLQELGITGDVRYVHGSTVATNALLERRGAQAAFLATGGFRDLLYLQRQTRTELYALNPSRTEPLVPRELCFEVAERVDRHGDVLTPLDEAALERILDRIVAGGAESLAVTFLFSFVRPEHERRVAEKARARGLSVSLSSEILPEYREYERASTTVANAYVAPLMDRYLVRLEGRLEQQRGASPRVQIMQSNGGVISVAQARRDAVRTVLSGPAGGIMGAWQVGQAAGFERLITFDMGGTSTDVAVIEGAPTLSTENAVSGLPIRVPMLDIHTVGAGGGSLARRDAGGGLQVGPESAGADPGPAAYGKGTEPTVTDCNLLLGRLQPDWFLEGRMKLDVGRSRAALEPLGRTLRLDSERMAEGVVRVADVQMARALRKVSVERGHDPRRFCLLAFGGGGPLHACALAEEVGIPEVLIPRYPGILSALGMVLSDIGKEYSRTVMRPLDGPLDDLDGLFWELERRACEELATEGVAPENAAAERWADLRYQGQSYELSLPVRSLTRGELERSFHEAHRSRFGCASEGAPCELVNLRVRASGRVDKPALPYKEPAAAELPNPAGSARVYMHGWLECPVFDRDTLQPGTEWVGPALVTQADTTTWLPPGWYARVDGWYNVLARRI